MRNQTDYLEQAREHLTVFKDILSLNGVSEMENDSAEDLYQGFSTGDRNEKWTVLDFQKTGEDEFIFVWENIGFLSGSGREDYYKLVDGKPRKVRSGSVWMS